MSAWQKRVGRHTPEGDVQRCVHPLVLRAARLAQLEGELGKVARRRNGRAGGACAREQAPTGCGNERSGQPLERWAHARADWRAGEIPVHAESPTGPDEASAVQECSAASKPPTKLRQCKQHSTCLTLLTSRLLAGEALARTWREAAAGQPLVSVEEGFFAHLLNACTAGLGHAAKLCRVTQKCGASSRTSQLPSQPCRPWAPVLVSKTTKPEPTDHAPAWLLARKRLRGQRCPTRRSSISREPSAVCTAATGNGPRLAVCRRASAELGRQG